MTNRSWVRVALAFLAIPIAVTANGFRIFGTGLIAQYLGEDKAKGFLHLFEGWLVFLVSLIMLFVVHWLMTKIWKENPQAAQKRDDPGAAAMNGQQAQGNASALLIVAIALILIA